MKNKERKSLQLKYARENINYFFRLLDKRFCAEYDKMYVREIKRLSEGFNIRLSREEKLKFCKRCNLYWDSKSHEIRFDSDSNVKEYICKNCSYVRRFRYK